MEKMYIYDTATRIYNLDSYGARDNNETVDSIAETIETDPCLIISYLLDVIDELEA